MNNIIHISDVRQRSVSDNINSIYDIAKQQFEEIKKSQDIITGNFEDKLWRYQGTNIHFSTLCNSGENKGLRFEWQVETSNLIKAFMINLLYKNRVKKKKLSVSRVFPIRKIGDYLHENKIIKIEMLNNITYELIVDQIIKDKQIPDEDINNLNAFIDFITKKGITRYSFNKLTPSKNKVILKKKQDSKKNKMPDHELVRAVIQLRWAIEEKFDNTDRMISDMLGIYTQAFSYALGLRAGEILRIPFNCLIEDKNHLRCIVYTEKGSPPRSVYVPVIWQELIKEIVEKIKAITAIYRKRAIELENTQRLSELDDRLSKWRKEKKQDASNLTKLLNNFLKNKHKEAFNTWKTKSNIKKNNEYYLSELDKILPIYSTAKRDLCKIKAYDKWNLTTRTKLENGKKVAYVSGSDLLNFIDEQINLRKDYLTENEFMMILHGRDIHRANSGDKSISILTNTAPGSTATCYTFAPENFSSKGRAPAVMHRDDAIKKLTEYAYGGFDINNEIDLLSFKLIFPELAVNYSGNNKHKNFTDANKDYKISQPKKIYVKVKNPDSYINYSVNEGYTISIDSIHSYIYKKFVNENYKIEREIWEESLKEAFEDNSNIDIFDFKTTEKTISSSTFSINQKVSEFLFLRCSLISSNSNSLVPELYSYSALRYFFCGNERVDNAFKRYGIELSAKIASSWKSHQGRHWKTTSMLRAGLEAMVVNSYMGRTLNQLDHYDHNTGLERAKMVGELMVNEQNRFLGEIPHVVEKMKSNKVDVEDITAYLNDSLQTIQHTPLGYCTRSLNLNPCEINMQCLTGKNGNGCNRYIFDTKDKTMLQKLVVEKSKNENEIIRLLDILEEGNEAVERYIVRSSRIVENIDKIISLTSSHIGTDNKNTEITPFLDDGDKPEDCPFCIED